MSAKPITIVGGGLAGLTLGIGLRRRGVPVTVWEAGHYPRHRVCGEFISGRGQETLSQLGLRELLERAGAVNAGTAAFFSAARSTPPRSLPVRAICLSRFTMDHVLAVEFRRLGGELLEDQRRRDADFAEGIVRATGRRAQTGENGSRWFGLKVHARNVPLTADLEMHVSPRGYVGLCRVDGGAVNVCGLFRRRAGADRTPQNWREWLRGQTGSPLNRRLAAAEFDESSFCAVAGISLRPQRAGDGQRDVHGGRICRDGRRTAGRVERRGNFVDGDPANACPSVRHRVCAAACVGKMVAADDARPVAAKHPRRVRRAQRMVLANGI